jgi:MFS family permease
MESRLIQKDATDTVLTRGIVLATLGLCLLFSYYAYDCLSPLVHLFEKKFPMEVQAQWLQAADTVPGIVIVVYAGMIVDEFGAGVSAVVFSLIAACGSAVLLLANESFAGMFLGRMLFGLGVEPLIVAVLAALAGWFRNRNKALAIGIALGLARLGSALAYTANLWTPSSLRANPDANIALLLWLGAIAGMLAVLCAVVFYMIHRRSSVATDPADKVRLRDILKFSSAVWILGLIAFCFYSASYGFSKLGQDVLGEIFEKPGLPLAVMTLSAMILNPAVGWLVDRYGVTRHLLIAGTSIFPFLFIGIIYGGPRFLFWEMLLFGFCVACISGSLWPLVPGIIPESRVGTAFGVIAMLQNLGIVITTFVAGWVKGQFPATANGGAIGELYVFAAAAALAFLATVWLVLSSATSSPKRFSAQP